MPEVNHMVKSQWELVFSESRQDGSSLFIDDSGKFKDLVFAIEGKGQLIFLVKYSSTANSVWPSGEDMVLGVYSHSEIKTGLKDSAWPVDADCSLAGSPYNFAFFYNGEKEMVHFEPAHNQSHFGFIYTAYHSGAIAILNEFMLISWAEDFENKLGQVSHNLTCVENPKYNSATSFSPSIKTFEVWHYQPG